jgi:hypothetical protein
VRDLLHRLAVENELLQYENTGLRDAVATKKKQKKKSKALNLQQHQEYHGGAMAWSPRSFREARRRNKVDTEVQHQQELQKLEMKEAKRVSKLYQEKLKEEQRLKREEAAEVRRKEKAERRRQIDARKAEKERLEGERNAAKALQLPQKGKRRALQAPQPKKRQKRVDTRDVGGADAHESLSATPPITTRSGRNVTLPSKYK